MAVPQYVDPKVSRRKFDREIEDYRRHEADYRRRGWFLVEANFPCVLVILCAAKLRPPAVITGVRFDYSNYDAAPPSVRLVDPFTAQPYKAAELPTTLNRQVDSPQLPAGFALPPGANVAPFVAQSLMQAYGPEDIPFLCLAGVREYHEHPAHSGDAWELHRSAGAGRLVRLLEVIDTYGIRPISGYNVELVPRIAGFAQNEIPQ
jgi:Predicted metal binding domain